MRKHQARVPRNSLLRKSQGKAVYLAWMGLAIFVGAWLVSREAPEREPRRSETADAPAPAPVDDPAPRDELGLHEELADVADAYEANSRYPVTSIPVVGERYAEPVPPFERAEVESIYPRDRDDLDDPLRIAASVEKMEYFANETIVARVIVAGGGVESPRQIEATGSIADVEYGEDTGLTAEFESSGDGLEFRASFDTSTIDPARMPREAVLRVVVTVDRDRPWVQTVPFYFAAEPSAHLEGVGSVEQRGAFLRIPLEFSVEEAGYYYVDSFLDDAATQRPMVRLRTEGRLSEGSDELTLEAHLHALRDAGSPGPYNLRVVRAYCVVPGRSASTPATVSQPSGYPIEGVPFSRYEDTPYVDAYAEQRVEFLRDVARSMSGP